MAFLEAKNHICFNLTWKLISASLEVLFVSFGQKSSHKHFSFTRLENAEVFSELFNELTSRSFQQVWGGNWSLFEMP